MKEEFIKIGIVRSPVGLRGEFKCEIYSQSTSNLRIGQNIVLETSNQLINACINRLRVSNNSIILGLDCILDRTQAESVRDASILVCLSDLSATEDGEYYVKDLVGLSIFDIDQNQIIGTLEYVNTNTHQAILVCQNESKEFMVPYVPEIVKSIDFLDQIIKVKLPAGLLDL